MTQRTLLALVLALSGCTGTNDPEAAPSTYAIQIPVTDAAQILALVNYPGTTLDVLDNGVGLDARAAHGIIAHRNGADGVAPSSDDVLFADLAQLDAIAYVGDVAFTKLQAYATAHPAPAAESVEGVAFQGWEAEAVVWGVDDSASSELDALLDARASRALFDHRPFATVTQMGPQPYVGPSALERLRGAAAGWWQAMHGATHAGGTFDGVSFDDAAATTALAIANGATATQLTAHGMTSAAAGHVVAARPVATLAALAATSGIGPATMNALHVYATSGDWGSAPACIATFQAAVAPHLADLLFLSESDRPFDFVSYPGAGQSTPTGASVLATVGGPEPGSTFEVRSVDNYYVDFEPASDMADPNAAAAVEAAFGTLTDVIYVAIHAPATSVYRAEVHVYLLGRTSCGDLVGIHAISIET